jgi:hypothetical protein
VSTDADPYEERGYAFRFRSSDGPEPPHVPVEGNGGAAKFWLRDVELASATGYTRRQLDAVAEMVRSHRSEFLDKWHEFFG